MSYNFGRVDDIISALDSIKQKQDISNHELSRVSETILSINLKMKHQLEGLRNQIYIFSNDMGWLGIWDIAVKDYIGFINIGISNVAKITISKETGKILILAENGSKIFVINPYLPGITESFLFDSVASFTITPDGKRIFISQIDSSILSEIDVCSGKTIRNFTLPGTAIHLIFDSTTDLIYFSLMDTKAVYSVERQTGNIEKVFDLPEDAVKMAPFSFGKKFGLLVLNGSGDTAAITKWDRETDTTNTVQVANASEIVVNPYTGENFVVSLQNILFRSLDGMVLKTIDLGQTARQLTLTADGIQLFAVVDPGQDMLIVDTISGNVSDGPKAIYPPSQQAAELLQAYAQFGFASN